MYDANRSLGRSDTPMDMVRYTDKGHIPPNSKKVRSVVGRSNRHEADPTAAGAIGSHSHAHNNALPNAKGGCGAPSSATVVFNRSTPNTSLKNANGQYYHNTSTSSSMLSYHNYQYNNNTSLGGAEGLFARRPLATPTQFLHSTRPASSLATVNANAIPSLREEDKATDSFGNLIRDSTIVTSNPNALLHLGGTQYNANNNEKGAYLKGQDGRLGRSTAAAVAVAVVGPHDSEQHVSTLYTSRMMNQKNNTLAAGDGGAALVPPPADPRALLRAIREERAAASSAAANGVILTRQHHQQRQKRRGSTPAETEHGARRDYGYGVGVHGNGGGKDQNNQGEGSVQAATMVANDYHRPLNNNTLPPNSFNNSPARGVAGKVPMATEEDSRTRLLRVRAGSSLANPNSSSSSPSHLLPSSTAIQHNNNNNNNGDDAGAGWGSGSSNPHTNAPNTGLTAQIGGSKIFQVRSSSRNENREATASPSAFGAPPPLSPSPTFFSQRHENTNTVTLSTTTVAENNWASRQQKPHVFTEIQSLNNTERLRPKLRFERTDYHNTFDLVQTPAVAYDPYNKASNSPSCASAAAGAAGTIGGGMGCAPQQQYTSADRGLGSALIGQEDKLKRAARQAAHADAIRGTAERVRDNVDAEGARMRMLRENRAISHSVHYHR